MSNWYKIAKQNISPEEMENIRNLLRKIVKGNRNWTNEELQLQQNYPDLIEELLIKLMKGKYELA